MANTKVRFETTKGALVIELDDEKAPNTAKNFADRVREVVATDLTGTPYGRRPADAKPATKCCRIRSGSTRRGSTWARSGS